MMHPHNLYHLTLRICISRGVRHTSQRSATSPSPFIIIFLEFFFLKSNPPSILPFPPPPKKKKSFQPYEPIAILALKHSHSRSYMLFLFVSRVCSMVMPFFILLCLSCRYHHVSAREMIKEAMRSWKKKKKERGKKKTRVQRFDGNGIEWSGITEIAMIVSFVDSFIIDWLLLLLQIILLRVPHLNDEQSYYDYRIIFFSFPPSP